MLEEWAVWVREVDPDVLLCFQVRSIGLSDLWGGALIRPTATYQACFQVQTLFFLKKMPSRESFFFE